jgi:hypothetical protein
MKTSRYILIFFSSFIISMIFMFMSEVIIGQIVIKHMLNNFEDEFILLSIIMSFLSISIVSSFLSTFVVIEKEIRKRRIFFISGLTILSTILFLYTISYGSIMLFYIKILWNLNFIEFILVFPMIVVYFAVYVMKSWFFFLLLMTFSYNFIFVIVLYAIVKKEEGDLKN